MKLFLLMMMVLCHIVDDFYLQEILAQLKQKKWWAENANDLLYRNDYVIALIIHSLSWAIMINLPLAICSLSQHNSMIFIAISVIVNAIIHAVVDDLKANKLKISLVTDQIIHFLQIIITFTIFCLRG